MRKTIYSFFATALIMVSSVSSFSQPIRLFAGTYTEKGPKGLYLFDLNREQGTFKLLSAADAGPNPSYFCISAKTNLIYAANEVMQFKGSKGGGVTAVRYNPGTGGLEKVKDLVVPDGGPCFISLSPNEDYLLMASYSSSSIAVVKLDSKGMPVLVSDTILFDVIDGKISHPHMIAFGPGGKKVYLTDLGLDRIVIYDFDAATGRLKQIENGIVNFPRGTGPRHFVFNSAGTKMYVICELNSTISVLDVAANGTLKAIQSVSALAPDFNDDSACADIHLGKNGQYLYGSNRGENTIVVFKVGTDGKLVLAGRVACGGDWPRNFVIDPSGKYMIVANQKSGNIVLFNINEKTGLPVAASKEYKVSAPVCLKF